ncbi:50S ribosomal protein L27 [Candidatus Mycoplasma mahonii]|uniref:50S ribosomal protein L27 n=1 Tax=Candidatus Mycoplasma mahonii TaxID=3004105 RepID=UPI0026F3694D|nr:50S ribosomal protein L27 [Candidatus Mycoplasma mahonii]WKX02326.1 50S ribosomal protein L27 [Candidatus Mycoplasma mahonii]
MSSVKSGGSSKNGRDSKGRRLGAKLADGQFALAGSIIYKQRGTKIHPGNNVGIGNDHTLYTLIDGIIKFEKRRNRKYASAYVQVKTKVKNPTAKPAA